MANTVKYNNVDFGVDSPIKGERLATNGNYTGEHKGTPMQDAKSVEGSRAHYVEGSIVRYGTLMQDAADKNFPTEVEE
jgi:hypothetical protein